MEQYGKILMIAMPVFLILVIGEKIYGFLRGKDTVRTMDMISSLSSGITNVVKDILGLTITIISYGWLVDHVALFHIKPVWLVYTIGFIALDFHGYWVHRLSHQVNLFWNKHAIHHSSEEFNLACALRQSISSFVNLFTVFLLPAAFLGVPKEVISVIVPLHLFAQFWYHTQHIEKMGILEYILVTPSHHRVHHAINPEYMDKNHSQIFIIWDKLFGTFQEELPDVKPVYGITRPAHTWNPVRINFQHLWLLARDAFFTASFIDKLRIWFMPTGWRPPDVVEKYPVQKIEDVYNFQKYETNAPALLQIWSGIQLTAVFIFALFFFGNLKQIGTPELYIYGLFVFISVYAYTELMDGKANAFFWECLKTLNGIILLYAFRADNLLNQIIVGGKYVVLIYLILSLMVTGWLCLDIFKNEPKLQKI